MQQIKNTITILPLQLKKPKKKRTKLVIKKRSDDMSFINFDITCIQIYNNTIFLGTNQSKIIVYDKIGDDFPIKLSQEKSFYPHCTTVSFIKAGPKHLIILPQHESESLIRIWDKDTLKIVHGYKGHNNQISDTIFLNNHEHIVSCSHDGTVRVWELKDTFEFDECFNYFDNKYPVLAVQQINDDVVAFGGDDCYIKLWNWRIKNQGIVCKIFAHPGSVLALAYYEPYIVSFGGDSKLMGWNLDINKSEGKNSYMLKEQKKLQTKNLNRKIYLRKVSRTQLIIMDSKGELLTLTNTLGLQTKKIDIKYTEKIRSIAVMNHILFYVTTVKSKGQLAALQMQNVEEQIDQIENKQKFEVVQRIVDSSFQNFMINQQQSMNEMLKQQKNENN